MCGTGQKGKGFLESGFKDGPGKLPIDVQGQFCGSWFEESPALVNSSSTTFHLHQSPQPLDCVGLIVIPPQP